VVAVTLVVVSMLAVVAGHAVLATGQVRLSGLQSQLAAEQARHRQELLAVAGLETPSRIVSEAEGRLHMVQPTQVSQLPHVSLQQPEPTPNVAPAPPTTTTPSGTTTGG
jgi:hypothetical protein